MPNIPNATAINPYSPDALSITLTKYIPGIIIPAIPITPNIQYNEVTNPLLKLFDMFLSATAIDVEIII